MQSLYNAMFGVHRNGCSPYITLCLGLIGMGAVPLKCYVWGHRNGCSPFIMLCLGSKGMDSVTSNLCQKGEILQKELQETSLHRNYKK